MLSLGLCFVGKCNLKKMLLPGFNSQTKSILKFEIIACALISLSGIRFYKLVLATLFLGFLNNQHVPINLKCTSAGVNHLKYSKVCPIDAYKMKTEMTGQGNIKSIAVG